MQCCEGRSTCKPAAVGCKATATPVAAAGKRKALGVVAGNCGCNQPLPILHWPLTVEGVLKPCCDLRRAEEAGAGAASRCAGEQSLGTGGAGRPEVPASRVECGWCWCWCYCCELHQCRRPTPQQSSTTARRHNIAIDYYRGRGGGMAMPAESPPRPTKNIVCCLSVVRKLFKVGRKRASIMKPAVWFKRVAGRRLPPTSSSGIRSCRFCWSALSRSGQKIGGTPPRRTPSRPG